MNTRFSDMRGISSAGRAPHWQCGGQRFDPAMLHQKQETTRPKALWFIFYLTVTGRLIEKSGRAEVSITKILYDKAIA